MHDPVIILAPPRSFTSVVCAMLGQHPGMYGLPEVNLFVAETMAERQGLLARPRWGEHGLWRTIAQLFGKEQTFQTILLARRWLDIRAECSCVSVFRELAVKLSPRILVDKSPRSIVRCEYLQRIQRAFPNTRYIHLLRHPRSFGESILRLGGKRVAEWMDAVDYSTEPPTPDVQKSWYTLHMNIITFLAGVPAKQQKRIRGEDFLAKPDAYLREIAKWLSLSAEREAIEAMKHPEQSPYACFGPPNARFGSDPGFLEAPALRPASPDKELTLEGPLSWRQDEREFSPEVKELAREFGYK
jgi:hypothetical protein